MRLDDDPRPKAALRALSIVCGASVVAAWIESFTYSPQGSGWGVGLWSVALEGSLAFWMVLPAAIALALTELVGSRRVLGWIAPTGAQRAWGIGLALALMPASAKLLSSRGVWGALLFGLICAAPVLLARKLPTPDLRVSAIFAVLGFGLVHALSPFEAVAISAITPSLPERGDGSAPAADAPCVLLISVDTLRGDRVGAVREGRAVTPFLDRLAAEGVRATTISTSNQTGPAHASMLTGSHLLRSGVIANGWTIPPDVPTLAELVFEAGWRTGGVISNPVIRSQGGFARGFECYGDVSRVDSNASGAFFGVRRFGSRWHWLERMPALAGLWLRQIEWRVHMTPKWLQPTADDTLRRCRSLLGEMAQDPCPWFLFAHFMDPHHPYDPPQETRGTWSAESELRGIPTSSTEQFHLYRDSILQRAASGAPEIARHADAIAKLYDEEILFLDSQLELLIAEARSAAGARPLWIVLTSDHGEHLFEHGLLGHSNSLYEELLRLPLIIHGIPDLAAGDLPLRLEDVARFLAKRLIHEGAAAVLSKGSPSLPPGHSLQVWGKRASLRTDRWKLFAESDQFHGAYRAVALWDLAAPAGEARDVEAQHPEIASELLAELQSMVEGSVLAERPELEAGVGERMQRTLAQLGYADG